MVPPGLGFNGLFPLFVFLNRVLTCLAFGFELLQSLLPFRLHLLQAQLVLGPGPFQLYLHRPGRGVSSVEPVQVHEFGFADLPGAFMLPGPHLRFFQLLLQLEQSKLSVESVADILFGGLVANT